MNFLNFFNLKGATFQHKLEVILIFLVISLIVSFIIIQLSHIKYGIVFIVYPILALVLVNVVRITGLYPIHMADYLIYVGGSIFLAYVTTLIGNFRQAF